MGRDRLYGSPGGSRLRRLWQGLYAGAHRCPDRYAHRPADVDRRVYAYRHFFAHGPAIAHGDLYAGPDRYADLRPDAVPGVYGPDDGRAPPACRAQHRVRAPGHASRGRPG